MDTQLARSTGDWLRLEVDTAALTHNLAAFRQRVRRPARLLAVVKSDGYGHGLVLAARAFLAGGADMLGVHALAEAERLRAAGIAAPILILGPLTQTQVAVAAQLACEIVVASRDAAMAARAAMAAGTTDLRVHLKVETGVNRQGVREDELTETLAELSGVGGLQLVGVASHFADIEDTTDHTFARRQQARFDAFIARMADAGHPDLCRHMSCSASTLLWTESHRDLARVGVSAYGIWPSRETRVAVRLAGLGELDLKAAMTWRVMIAQIKRVPQGEAVGYGRTWLAPLDSRIAVLPVGYADGYPRLLSGRAHVLIDGQRAPVRGRICMNLCMVDVTHIPRAAAGTSAVLLGRDGEDVITAEQMADWLGTIPYEVLTLPRDTWRRVEATDV